MNWLFAPLLALIMAAGSYFVGYQAGDQHRNATWLALQTQAQAQAAKSLQEAQARGNRLSAELLLAESQINQQRGALAHALTQATTGRPCLGATTLRVLNTAPGLHVDNLPPTPGGLAAAGEPASPDTSDTAYSTWGSTDTGIALWIADAGSAFETCRTRLDALIDWHHQESSNP